MNPDQLELQFLKNYKRAVSGFHLLDCNMAACLRWANDDFSKEAFNRVISLNFDKKFKKVQSLIVREGLEVEYREFVASVEKCRSFRNQLVHGMWNLFGTDYGRIWYQVMIPKEDSGEMTQEEFGELADLVEHTNTRFNKLRKENPIEPVFKAQSGPRD